MITIDTEKCIGCMKCVSVCPFKVFEEHGNKPIVTQEKYCMKCLHCAATCPEKAIKLGDLPGVLEENLPCLPPDFSSLLESHLMKRRSYRFFSEKAVEKEILNKALQISAWAPSAKNQHPTKWIVIEGTEKINEITKHILEYVKETGQSPEIMSILEKGNNVVVGNAKTLLLAYAKKTAINASTDSAIALYGVELMLQAQGIGTCWAGYLTRLSNTIPALRAMMKLPEGCDFYGALMMGYPQDEEYIHVPNRHKLADIQWL